MNRRHFLKSTLIVLAASKGWSQEPSAKEKWDQLSEEERNRIRENFKKWKALPQDRKDLLRERFKRFQGLSSERRLRLRELHQRFRRMPSDRQARIRERAMAFRKLPEGVRLKRINRFRQLRERRHR